MKPLFVQPQMNVESPDPSGRSCDPLLSGQLQDHALQRVGNAPSRRSSSRSSEQNEAILLESIHGAADPPNSDDVDDAQKNTDTFGPEGRVLP